MARRMPTIGYLAGITYGSQKRLLIGRTEYTCASEEGNGQGKWQP